MTDVTVEVESPADSSPDEGESPPSDERVAEALAANDAEHAATEAEEAQQDSEAAAEASVGAATASLLSAEVIAEQLAETQALINQHTELINSHLALLNAQQSQQVAELAPVETPPVVDTAPSNQSFLARRWWGGKE